MKGIILSPLIFALCISKVSSQSASPTWSADVACIVYSHCASCHNPNGIAPFSLSSYADAYTYRYAIQGAVMSGHMPPWPPDASYRSLAHERILTSEEKALIEAWVNEGAPQGNPDEEPEAPVFESPAEISSPNWTGTIPNYTVPAINGDLYRCFVIPTNTTVDQFITAFEILPGNRDIVHHVLVYQDDTGQALQLDAADPAPGYSSFGGVGVNSVDLIGGWVPGASAKFMPNNMGVKLKAGASIILQIHYPIGSSGQADNTQVRFKLSNGPMRELHVSPVLNHVISLTNGPLYIPANTEKTFHAQYTVPSPVSVIGIGPHAHLICESMWAYAVTLANDTIPLINIPDWDFHWQGFYDFRQPIKFPFGTKLHGYAHYNNTQSNPHNPNFPPQPVSLGEATTDEMMLFYFVYTGYQPGDENIIIDANDHTPHHLDCSPNTTVGVVSPSNTSKAAFEVFPNPTSGQFTLRISDEHLAGVHHHGHGAPVVYIRDIWGRLLRTEPLVANAQSIDIEELPSGVYWMTVTHEQAMLGTVKVVKN